VDVVQSEKSFANSEKMELFFVHLQNLNSMNWSSKMKEVVMMRMRMRMMRVQAIILEEPEQIALVRRREGMAVFGEYLVKESDLVLLERGLL